MKPRSSPQTDDSAREKSSDALGQGKISRLVAGFALSALAGLALNSIYSLTDAPPYTRLPRFPKMLDNPPPKG